MPLPILARILDEQHQRLPDDSRCYSNIPASLSRAAAKIIAQLHIEVPGYTAGHPTWSFKNFNTSTTLFSENTSKTLGDMGDTFESANGSNGNYTITTYSYAMHWEDNPEQMPQLIVKVPLTKMDESAEGEGKRWGNH